MSKSVGHLVAKKAREVWEREFGYYFTKMNGTTQKEMVEVGAFMWIACQLGYA